MTHPQALARYFGFNTLYSEARQLKIRLISTLSLITLLSLYSHTPVQADAGIKMSKTHEYCHNAMRYRHRFSLPYFTKRQDCKTIIETEDSLLLEKTFFAYPNTLIYTCRLLQSSSVNTPYPDCQALSKADDPSVRVTAVPDDPTLLLKDGTHLNLQESLSERITHALYNGGGQLVNLIFHGIIYQKIWHHYRGSTSNSNSAFFMMVHGMAWNTLAAYIHHTAASNIYRGNEFTYFESLSNLIEITLGTHDLLETFYFSPWPTTLWGKISAIGNIAFFGPIFMNLFINTAYPPSEYLYDNKACPPLTFAPFNAHCSKQIEQIDIYFDP